MTRVATLPLPSEVKRRGIDSIKNWPAMKLTAAEFNALPEYSATEPTGVVEGKLWRRLDGLHDDRCPKHMRVWMICKYQNLRPGKQAGTTDYEVARFRPVIVVRATLAKEGKKP